MSNVVQLRRQEPDADAGDWGSGPMVCLSCKHEWVGVTPVGVNDGFECPSCGLSKGTTRGLYLYREEDHFACNCGCILMHITRQRIYCPQCGVSHKPFD